jgi:hypothetical protein
MTTTGVPGPGAGTRAGRDARAVREPQVEQHRGGRCSANRRRPSPTVAAERVLCAGLEELRRSSGPRRHRRDEEVGGRRLSIHACYHPCSEGGSMAHVLARFCSARSPSARVLQRLQAHGRPRDAPAANPPGTVSVTVEYPGPGCVELAALRRQRRLLRGWMQPGEFFLHKEPSRYIWRGTAVGCQRTSAERGEPAVSRALDPHIVGGPTGGSPPIASRWAARRSCYSPGNPPSQGSSSSTRTGGANAVREPTAAEKAASSLGGTSSALAADAAQAGPVVLQHRPWADGDP